MKKFMLALITLVAFNISLAQTFSYARLFLVEFPAIDGSAASWVTPEQTVTGEDFDEIFTQVLGRPRGEGESLLVTLLNALGAQGWELINYTSEVDDVSTEESYIFKRSR